MSAGQKVKTWFDNLEPVKDINSYSSQVKSRYREFKNLSKTGSNVVRSVPLVYIAVLTITFILYVVMGIGGINDYGFMFGRVKVTDKFSEELGTSLREAAQDPKIKELMQVVGSIAYDPFAGMLNQYGKSDTINTGEFLRQFYGALILLPILGNLTNVAGQAATGGFIKNLGKPIEEAYFTLGLGFIGWQGLSPLLSESVLAAVTREAKRTFRQTRFKSGDLIDQWIRGESNVSDVTKGLWDEGWRTEDIPTILKMARKILNAGEVEKLYKLGKFNEQQYRLYLRRLGFEDDAITWKVFLSNQENQEEPKGVSRSLAIKAFKQHGILEADFRKYLAALGLSKEAIDLEIEVIRFEEDTDIQTISVAQLESAFMQNVINRPEARKALIDVRYSEEGANLLLDTWEKKKAPKVLKLNQSSITNAVIKGVLTPAQGFNKLREIGLSEKDAEIVLDSIKVEHGVAVKTPSDSVIIRALQMGLISHADAITRLKLKNYSEKDADLIVRLATTNEAIELDTGDVEEAFLYGVLERSQAESALQTLGATANYIAIRLDTVEKRRARLKTLYNASQVGKWYRQELISHDEAMLKLASLGTSREDNLIFLQSVSKAEPTPLSDNAIQDALVSGVIDQTKALALFKELGLSDENAQIRLETIQSETGIVKAKVSIATLLSATRDGILTTEQLEERLANMGLDAEDIALYLAIAEKRNTNVETKLTKADIIKGYKLGRLNDAEALALLESKGYSLEEAGYLLSLELRDIEVSDVYQDILSGNVDVESGINQLLGLGYSIKEITDALANADLGE